MNIATEDTTATTSADTASAATQASEPTSSQTSDAGTTFAQPQVATQPDATSTPSSFKSPIQRSDPPDSVVLSNAQQRPLNAQPRPAQGIPNASPQQNPQTPVDWQKRFNDSQPYITKLQQENQQFRQQSQAWDGLDPQQIRQQQQLQQQQAQQAALKPWNRDHTDNARFNDVRGKLKAQYELANSLPPEVRDQAMRSINASVSESDRKSLEEYRAFREREESMTPEERDDRVREMAAQVFQAKLQEYEQFQQTRAGTQQFLQQNADFVDKYRDVVLWGMNHPARREVGVRLAQLEAENQALRQKTTGDVQEIETARARDAITKHRATVRRDASTSGVSDPAAEAVKLGLRGDAAFDYITKQNRQ